MTAHAVLPRFSEHEKERIRERNPISEVVGRHVTWDRRKSIPAKGEYWACCPFHAEKSASFKVDDRTGRYHCFGCGADGDVFKFVAEWTQCSFPEAIRQLGGSPDDIQEDPEVRRERDRRARAKREADERAAAEDAARRQDSAAHLWETAGPIQGTPGALYLANRGLPVDDLPAELRYLPRCRHQSGQWSGAIIARVLNQAGAFSGVWRIYVTLEGRKAFGSDSKMGLGPTRGGAVRLYEARGGEIGIGEGVETCQAVRALARGSVSIWAGLSTSGIAGFEPPFEVTRLTIYPDADLSRFDASRGRWVMPPGIAAALKLKARMDAEGIACVIQPPPAGKRDWLDVYNSMRERGLV